MRICACFGRGNLRGTWNTELCRFLTKSKSIYKNTSRTPYKPLVEIMKIKWNKKIWCSLSVPKKQKSTHERIVSAWFSSSGTQDVSVAARRLLLILSVRSHFTQESCLRNPCEVFMRAAIKPSFASLTSVHCHFCRFESKLSVAVAVMSGPFGAWLKGLVNKKSTAECCAFL